MDEQLNISGIPLENTNTTKDKWLKGLTIAGYASSGLAVVSLVLIVAAVIGDWNTTGALFIVIFFLSLLVSVAGIIASLIRKRWWLAGGGCACFVLTLALGFFAAILVAVGQHHPPERSEDIPLDELLVTDWLTAKASDNVTAMSAHLAKGSWWTDGRHYFQATPSDDTTRMDGMTLHEGGFEFQMVHRDSALYVVCADPDICPFGTRDSRVEHLKVRISDNKSLELLVAYDPASPNTPIAALQRFDGEELRYELSAIAALLEGNYVDEDGTPWSFDRSGRMRIGEKGTLKPYTVEQIWHMPINVIKLANGQRYGVRMTEIGIVLCTAVYNSDEEQWTPSYDVVKRLERSDPHEWMEHQLVCGAIRNFIEEDYDFSHLSNSSHPLVQLNLLLMNSEW